MVTPYNRNCVTVTNPFPSAGETCLIYNPVAGKLRKNPGLIPEAVRRLEAQGWRVKLTPTTGPETAGPLAKEAIAGGAGRIAVAGGDGTINEVVAGVAGSGVPLLVLPAGTANVLAMETGLGGNLLKVAERASGLQEQSVALTRLRQGAKERLFLLMAGVGLDARIVRMVRPETKKRWGKLSYWEGGFSQVGQRLPEFEVEFDGRRQRASFALLSRVRNYGGDLEIARHANLLEDELAVVLFEGPSSLRYLKYFSGVLINALEGMKGVTLAKTRALEFRPVDGNEIDVQVDGEYAGLAPARIEMAEERVKLMLPAEFARKMGRAGA